MLRVTAVRCHEHDNSIFVVVIFDYLPLVMIYPSNIYRASLIISLPLENAALVKSTKALLLCIISSPLWR